MPISTNKEVQAIAATWLGLVLEGKDSVAGPGAVKPFTLNRAEIIALGDRPTQENLNTLLAVIGSDVSENNRESAIRKLGQFGGLRVIDLLEAIASNGDMARFARGAAANALHDLNLTTRDKEPLVNPLKVSSEFVLLSTTQAAQSVPQRRDRNTALVSNYFALDTAIPWSPDQAHGGIRVDMRASLDCGAATKIAEKQGLKVSSLGNAKMIEISGKLWPGAPHKCSSLTMTLLNQSQGEQSKNQISIFFRDLPSALGADTWSATARFAIRTAKWLGAQ